MTAKEEYYKFKEECDDLSGVVPEIDNYVTELENKSDLYDLNRDRIDRLKILVLSLENVIRTQRKLIEAQDVAIDSLKNYVFEYKIMH